MTVPTNHGAWAAAGSHATSRRGGVSMTEIDQMRQRLGARATPAQIAKALGRCEADVRAIIFPAPVEPKPQQTGMAPQTSRPWSETDLSILRLMYCEAGATAEACAYALNRSADATKTQIQKRGLTRAPRVAA